MPPTRALSIRQPRTGQIMSGSKTIEYRSRVYIYADKNPGDPDAWDEIDLKPGDRLIGFFCVFFNPSICV